jgi:phosphatidylserine synthase
MVGVALNIAALMVIALVTIALHFWHPKIELIIPVTTCVLAVLIYSRVAQYGSRGGGYQRSSR